MRIATLQFCPTLGDPVSSIQKADKLLRKAETAGKLNDLDILVLPEQAFTGRSTSSTFFPNGRSMRFHIIYSCTIYQFLDLRTTDFQDPFCTR